MSGRDQTLGLEMTILGLFYFTGLETCMAEQDVMNAAGEEQKDKIDCSIKIEDSGAWKKKVIVEIPRSQIDKELDSQYKELMKSSVIPGFRKGRAPRRLVEKRFGEDISDQTKIRLIAQALQQMEEGQDFEILGEPDFKIDDVKMPEQGDMKFEYEVEVKPQFELPKLEGIKVEKEVFEVTEERLDTELEMLCRRLGRMEHLDEGAAKDDDLVIADVTVKIEGVEEPETRQGMPVRVGSTAVMGILVENMGEVLKGIKVGQTRTCSATVPDTHPKEAYRGKKADFTIEAKSFDRLIPAELNEEFFKSLGVDDKEDLRKRIRENLEDRADRESRNLMKQQIYDYLEKEIQFDLPAGVAARHAARMLAHRYYELLEKGIPQDRIHENLEKLKASASAESARDLKMSFVMDKVADKLEIQVADGELNMWVAQIAMNYGRRPEKVRDEMQREGRLEALRDQIRHDKAVEKILEMAEVVDAPARKKEEKSDKKEAKSPKTAKKAAKNDDDTSNAAMPEESQADEAKPKKAASRKQVNRKPPAGE